MRKNEPRTAKSNRRKVRPDLSQVGLPTRFPDFFHTDPVSRRSALKLMGASAAMAFGLAGCDRKPVRPIISRVDPPEYMKPGRALLYSSTWTGGPVPYGMIVRTLDGRPVGIEGDPECPFSRGRARAEMKAALLSLYDPDRLRRPRIGGKEATWEEVDRQVAGLLADARSIVLLTGAALGPAQRRLVAELTRRRPVTHLVWEPLHDRERRLAWRECYGAEGELVPRYDRARVILSLDADFLGTDGDTLTAAREYARNRKPGQGKMEMNRLWVAEGAVSLTGTNADHRIRLAPSGMQSLADALRRALAGKPAPLQELARARRLEIKVLKALAADLQANRGRALVVAGPHLPREAHAAVALLNEELAVATATLDFNGEPHRLLPHTPEKISRTLEEGPDLLLCLGVNPVHDWPGGGFDRLMAKARTTLVHALTLDETAAAARFALPSAHPLESWNDAHPLPGRLALSQPVIAPLFDSRQEYESLFRWTFGPAGAGEKGRKLTDWHDWVQAGWPLPEEGRQEAWEEVLRRGHLGEGEFEELPALDRPAAEKLAARRSLTGPGLELAFAPHHALGDGRHAGNGWLQELPHPVSRIVWDNPVEISPALAREHGLEEGDLARITWQGRTLRAPVLIQPGAADDLLLLPLGGGRTQAGPVGTGRGVNPAPLRSPDGLLAGRGVKLEKAGGRVPLVRTQKHFSMEGRPLALDADLAEYGRDPHFVDHRQHLPEPARIHAEQDFTGRERWAMAIDLSACTGCGTCVAACQAENNIPVVGKEECAKGREMHWMRIDLYREGSEEEPVFHQQPVTCHHCDNAPCEMVCPVQATSHSPEGINEMTYNRCVGTRYCANNCPYKVRRFNFFDYQARNLRDPVQELAHNPQVTVRCVGVMEKCTFCIQRINTARFAARNEGRRIEEGEVVPACMQACPAGAIRFGDLNDEKSAVAAQYRHERAYFLLEQLNTRPTLSYLARVRNPHPDLAGKPAGGGHGGHR